MVKCYYIFIEKLHILEMEFVFECLIVFHWIWNQKRRSKWIMCWYKENNIAGQNNGQFQFHDKLIRKVQRMKTCGEIHPNMIMPGVTVKSRGIDPSGNMDHSLSKAYINARNVLPPPQQPPPLIPTSTTVNSPPQSYKGFYTWLSSPKTMNNHRKMNNVAVIAPTQHHT